MWRSVPSAATRRTPRPYDLRTMFAQSLIAARRQRAARKEAHLALFAFTCGAIGTGRGRVDVRYRCEQAALLLARGVAARGVAKTAQQVAHSTLRTTMACNVGRQVQKKKNHNDI